MLIKLALLIKYLLELALSSLADLTVFLKLASAEFNDFFFLHKLRLTHKVSPYSVVRTVTSMHF